MISGRLPESAMPLTSFKQASKKKVVVCVGKMEVAGRSQNHGTMVCWSTENSSTKKGLQ